MPKSPISELSRRERQIMDILYRLERATAGDVLAQLPGQPNYSTVRAQLRVLEEKGHVRHDEQGLRYVYSPMHPRRTVRKTEMKRLIETFFEGSVEKVVAALLDSESARLSEEQLKRLSNLIEKARKERPHERDRTTG